MRAGLILALLAVATAGCGKRDTDPGPGGVTVGEARELDEAADKLEQRPQAPVGALPAPDASATGG